MMELSALCQPLPGRPFFVEQDGGRVYISVHDNYHIKILQLFKRKIRTAHPDVNHCIWSTSRTRKLLSQRKHWIKGEANWYARFGLEPPEKGRTECNSESTGKALLLG